MKIKLTSIYVDDQDRALAFYTDLLGFVKKADVTQGGFRWLTIGSPEEPDGTQMQLVLNEDPVARGYQQAMYQQDQPAAIFHTDDLQRDYDRFVDLGVTFKVPLTRHSWGSMAVLDDTCGNLIQLTQPAR